MTVAIIATASLESRALLNLENRVMAGVRTSMQTVVDVVTNNIKGRFEDAALADTVEGNVGNEAGASIDQSVIVGRITSTWPAMIWYEKGRPPGGKMPPKAKIVGWAVRKNIQPDPETTKIAFAFAINAARLKRDQKKVPISILVEWQNRKGIVPSKEFALDSLAYAIGLKIVRDGITGHHYFQQGLDASRAQITASFEDVAVATTGIA